MLHDWPMKKDFFRKMGFGLGPDETLPEDPVAWAEAQVETVPPLVWDGDIPTAAHLLDERAKFVYTDRRVIRKKFRDDRRAYREAKDQLRWETGEKYYESLDIAIRHNTALKSQAPVFERLWLFWHNHFAVAEKAMLACWNTGAYTRETIRPNMCGSFTDLVKAVTTSWTMIHHLDNSESVGPNSERGRWRRRNGKPATVNENHARELLELHTVSPAAGYTQKDVVSLSYIMAGWENRWSEKREECNPVRFDAKSHEPGNHVVLGKRYKQRGLSPKSKLNDVIEDLCAHPMCAEFVSTKLVRHFVSDDVTPEMVAPVIKAWQETDGHLPAVYKALIRVVYDHTGTHRKFLNPEVWMLQSVKLGQAPWPPQADEMKYDFKSKPKGKLNRPRSVMWEIGHHPHRPAQPNGWPDTEAEWLSPELLIRRLALAKRIADNTRIRPAFDSSIAKNFDNATDVIDYLNACKGNRAGDYVAARTDGIYLFPSEWMLKV
ncbi:MAG: DUF1800 family protein [Alphaproteobacteria bacterium]|nr:DUF1800 family protein [Alphaproteobacteria bacterium]